MCRSVCVHIHTGAHISAHIEEGRRSNTDAQRSILPCWSNSLGGLMKMPFY